MMNHQFLFNNLGNSHFFPCFFFPLKIDQTLQIVWSGSGQGNIFLFTTVKRKKKLLAVCSQTSCRNVGILQGGKNICKKAIVVLGASEKDFQSWTVVLKELQEIWSSPWGVGALLSKSVTFLPVEVKCIPDNGGKREIVRWGGFVTWAVNSKRKA